MNDLVIVIKILADASYFWKWMNQYKTQIESWSKAGSSKAEQDHKQCSVTLGWSSLSSLLILQCGDNHRLYNYHSRPINNLLLAFCLSCINHSLILFSGSIKSTSVSLAISSHVSLTSSKVLKRQCGDDKSWEAVTLLDNAGGGSIKVISLSPYTCYQFSLVQCNIQSPPSYQIHTLSSGEANLNLIL